MLSISAEIFDDDAGDMIAIKIGTDAFEINVSLSMAEVDRLQKVKETPWSAGALRIGSVADAPAWWCVADTVEGEDQQLSILVGSDDETWDVAVYLPIDALNEILAEVASAQDDA